MSVMAIFRQLSCNSVELRSIRENLGLSMRDLHAASLKIAKRHNNHRFVIPPTACMPSKKRTRLLASGACTRWRLSTGAQWMNSCLSTGFM